MTTAFRTEPADTAKAELRRLRGVVPLNEVKNRFSTYLELSKREAIVVTKNSRPATILHAVTDEDIEDYLFESDPFHRLHRSPPAGLPAGRGHTPR